MHKPLFLLLAILAVPVAHAAPPDARAIMQRVEDRDDGDNAIIDMEMVLVDRHQNQRSRKIRRYLKDQGEDRQILMFFIEPADVRDTAFLTYDYDDYARDDDQWLYLPALRKSKRIASSDKSGSFMGSDFSYADMTRRNLDAWDYRLLKEDEVRGSPVWVIEGVPRTAEEIDETGYTKSVVFVRKDNDVVVRAVHWVKEGDKLKYFDMPRLERIDGIWTPLEMTMTTRKGKATEHHTVLRFHDVRYRQSLDPGLFSVRRLEQGL